MWPFAIFAMLLSALGAISLWIEYTVPALYESAAHADNVQISWLWFLGWLWVALGMLGTELQNAMLPEEPPTEPGYLIERICDGYPMIVGSQAYDRAYCTGDYYIRGLADRHVPVGQQYVDERLNEPLHEEDL